MHRFNIGVHGELIKLSTSGFFGRVLDAQRNFYHGVHTLIILLTTFTFNLAYLILIFKYRWRIASRWHKASLVYQEPFGNFLNCI